jgi:hypothetical protein
MAAKNDTACRSGWDVWFTEQAGNNIGAITTEA